MGTKPPLQLSLKLRDALTERQVLYTFITSNNSNNNTGGINGTSTISNSNRELLSSAKKMAEMWGCEEMPFTAASYQEKTKMWRGEGLPMAAMKCQNMVEAEGGEGLLGAAMRCKQRAEMWG